MSRSDIARLRGSLASAALLVIATLLPLAACRSQRRPTLPADPAPQGDRRSLPIAALAGKVAITVGDHVVSFADWEEDRLPERLLLRGPDGRELGQGEVRPTDRGWEARLRDAEGEPSAIAAGQQVVAVSGDGTGELLRLPDWRWAFDRALGRLRLLPAGDAEVGGLDRPLSLRLNGGPSGDGRGPLPDDPLAFAWDPAVLTGTEALTLELRSDQDRLTVRWPRRRPFLRVSLLPGDVTGNLAPNAHIALTLTRGADAVRGLAWSDESGAFTAWLYDEAGRRLVPRRGDLLAVSDGATILKVEVPEFRAAWSVDEGRLAGRAPAGAGLDFTLWNPWRPGETETPRDRAGNGGDWSLQPAKGLHPATHFYITTHLPFGDQLYYCQQIPMLYLEPGDGSGASKRAAQVEVQALWEVRAALELERQGRVIGGAEGGGPWSGNLDLVLRDDRGEPLAVQAGDRLRLSAEGQTLEAEVSAFDARFTGGPEQELVGRAPAAALVRLAQPENPAPEPVAQADAGGAWRLQTSERWTLATHTPLADALPLLAAGERVEAFTTLPSGHNLRRRFGGPKLEAALGEPGFRAVLPEGLDAQGLRLERAGKRQPLALTPAELTWGQAYSVSLGTGPEAEAGLQAGDRLELRSGDGAQLWEATLPALDATLSTAVVSGRAEAEGLLDIEVHLAPGEPPLRYAVPAGGDRWQVDLQRPPAGQAIAPLTLIRRVDLVWSQQGLSLRRHLGRPSEKAAAGR